MNGETLILQQFKKKERKGSSVSDLVCKYLVPTLRRHAPTFMPTRCEMDSVDWRFAVILGCSCNRKHGDSGRQKRIPFNFTIFEHLIK